MSDWKRIEKVINWTGLSANAFAMSIGLKRAENLYQIKKGNNSISKELAELIAIKHCNVNKSWLLTGEGEMLLTDSHVFTDDPVKKIPFYNFNLESDFDLTERDSSSYLQIPPLSNCDLAAVCVGESMLPDLKPGSIITLKKTRVDNILHGEMYYVVTEDFCTVKCIRKVNEDASKIRLVPKNKTDYDEVVIDKEAILQLYLVKGIISIQII